MKRPGLAFDMETFPNYVLYMFRPPDGTTGPIYWENVDGEEDRDAIRELIRTHTLITFNGQGFDVPLLMYMLYGNSTPEVYEAAKWIIENSAKWWNFEKQFKIKIDDPQIDHIDLMEVAPLTGSLKLYGGRMHAKHLQDLPVAHGSIITPEQEPILREYCANDLETTIQLFQKLKEQIELREAMTEQYGIDLRSKSDAQIAEAVIKNEVEKIQGRKMEKSKARPGDTFKYQIPGFVSFAHLDILNDIREAEFRVSDKGKVLMPEVLTEKEIKIGTGIYRMGIGGLHSSESKQVVEAVEDIKIIDFDVASYYPQIALNQRLYPKHIGEDFITVYQSIVNRRLEAKKNKQKTIAESLKITINGTFGKLGSKWSTLYSPDLLVQVTLTGQLAILMLVEAFWSLPDVEVISANTDGVTVACCVASEASVIDAAETWELITGFTLERTDYRGLYSRDVNNYVAVKLDGTAKTKGVYGEGLPLQKNPDANICSKAVIDFLTVGASLRGTITNATDIRDFLCIRQVKGGCVAGGRELGRVARWYYARGVEGHFTYKVNGYKVPDTDGAKALMTIEDYHRIPEDLDYEWYIREAEARLMATGIQEVTYA